MKLLLLVLFLFPATILLAQWEPDVRLTNDPNTSELSYPSQHCIAASGDTIHVVWSDTRSGSGLYEIYYKRSTDAGVSWSTDTRLSFGSGAQYPSITVQGSIVYVVWYGWYTTIKYTRSTDAGISWSSEIELYNSGASNPIGPCIAVSGSTVHVIWNDNSNIYYKRSTDSGLNWNAHIQLTSSSFAYYPSSLAVSNSDVHIVWDDNRNGRPEIYYKYSSDAGLSWGIDTRLTNNPYTTDQSPSISVYGSFVNVVWTNFNYIDYIMDISQVGSTDGGLNWGLITQITNYNSAHFGPTISASGSVLHVVWADDRDSIYEVYYNRSTDGGLNWEMDTRLTNGTVNSYFPAPFISTSLSKVHVIWSDYRDSFVGEIYYKRNPTGNPIPVELTSFNYSTSNNIITLNWTTATETNNSGFNIERSNGNEFKVIGFVAGHGTTTEIQSYTFTDNNVSTGKYSYRLKQIDLDGTFEYSKTIEVEVTSPLEFSIAQNYPNPFNPSTSIQYAIANRQFVSLKVYNVLGKEVATLVNEEKSAGSYQVEFKSSVGNLQLASGVYFYKLQAGSFVQTRKMILLR